MKTKIIRHRFQLLLVAAALLASIMVPLVRADTFDDRIKQLEAQQAADRQQATVLQAQAQTYQQAVDQLQTQINKLQVQIDANTAKSNDLQRQISEAEAELARQRNVLGQNIRAMYLEGDISTLEMLASSRDLGDFVDKQQYRNSVKDKIKDTVDRISILKNQLRTQKTEVERLLKEQQAMQGQLSADRNKQAEMLAYTDAQKRAYEAQIQATNQQINSLRSQQAAFYASITGGGRNNYGSSGQFAFRNLSSQQWCGGGYRFCAWGHDAWVSTAAGDTWALHLARECVHYAADRAARGRNLAPYRPGNAGDWPANLSGAPGVTINRSPAVGAVAVAMAGDIPPVGHVMYVEYDAGNGWVGVSQMNWDGRGSYSTMEIKSSGVWFIHFN